LRQLWQVPTLLLGLAALVAVCVLHPPWIIARPTEDNPTFAELRELLRQPEFDADHALKLGNDAVQKAHAPAAAAEAHFLLGSAYLLLAERAGPGKGLEQWREAHTHLEQARALGLAARERPRLDYRLAKTLAPMGEGPAKVIPALEHAIEAGADDDIEKARGYGLLAETYLKLPKPDLEKALEATDKQIGTAIIDDRLLGPARLRKGELLVKLNKTEEAAKVLKNVGAKAPPDVLTRARRQRVRLLEQLEQWSEAAPVWRAILDDQKSPPADRAAVQYHLGLCLYHSGDKVESLHAWQECANHDSSGEEGTAAALGVADLSLRQGQWEPGRTALQRALHEISKPADWHNSLVPLSRVCEVCEDGCKAALARGAFSVAVQLTQLYEKVALPGRVHDLRGEAATAGARAAEEKAKRATGDEARALYGEAEEFLRQAGEAYEKAAAVQTDPAEHAERLWLAGNRFLDGRDAKRAATAFKPFVDIATQPDLLGAKRFNTRLNEAWYKLAVAYRDSGDPDKLAVSTFRQATTSFEFPSPFSYRARFELAVSEPRQSDGSWTDSAKDLLEENLTKLHKAFPPERDEEAREKTLYALGDLYFARRKVRDYISKAVETLEEALRDFSANSQAQEARYQLAESYRLRADQRTSNLSSEPLTMLARLEIEKKVSDDRERAITNYQELSRLLEAKPTRDEGDERTLVYAYWAAADVRYWAGGYEKSAELFEALADRIKEKKGLELEYFSSLVGVVRGYQSALTTYATTESDYEARVRFARQKIQRVIPEIRVGLLNLEAVTRKPFEDWLKAFDQAQREGTR
jgi:tetratricopeptide (TPR) repeat protein